MKARINGRIYNTETAKAVAGYKTDVMRSDPNFEDWELFKKHNGEYFLRCSGGGKSEWSTKLVYGNGEAAELIIPIPAWLARNLQTVDPGVVEFRWVSFAGNDFTSESWDHHQMYVWIRKGVPSIQELVTF